MERTGLRMGSINIDLDTTQPFHFIQVRCEYVHVCVYMCESFSLFLSLCSLVFTV